jgi:hypothetical protein
MSNRQREAGDVSALGGIGARRCPSDRRLDRRLIVQSFIAA